MKRHNFRNINPLNTELNPICHLLALLGAQNLLHVSRIRVKMIGEAVSADAVLNGNIVFNLCNLISATLFKNV